MQQISERCPSPKRTAVTIKLLDGFKQMGDYESASSVVIWYHGGQAGTASRMKIANVLSSASTQHAAITADANVTAMTGEETPGWMLRRNKLAESFAKKKRLNGQCEEVLARYKLRHLCYEDQFVFLACHFENEGQPEVQKANAQLYATNPDEIKEGIALLRALRQAGSLSTSQHWIALKQETLKLPKKSNAKDLEGFAHAFLSKFWEGELHATCTRSLAPDIRAEVLKSFPECSDTIDPVDSSLFTALVFADMGRTEVTDTMIGLGPRGRCPGSVKGMVSRYVNATGMSEPRNMTQQKWSQWGCTESHGLLTPASYSRELADRYFAGDIMLKDTAAPTTYVPKNLDELAELDPQVNPRASPGPSARV